MRRVWITRHKATAAGHTKMKVYMEDPENGDTEINGCLCRKLGELRNDQQKHFAIGSDATKIFVVGDKLSRNLYNEFVEIPDGEEDVFLAGKNYFDPSAGNPFRFDGVTEEKQAAQNRKAGRRKGTGILVIAILAGILAGILSGVAVYNKIIGTRPQAAAAQTFDTRGLRITLTEDFVPANVDGYTACYSAGDTAVFVLREDFAAMEGFGDLSLADYGAMILSNNGLNGSVTLREEQGMMTFDWVAADAQTGTNFYYCCGLYKGQDAFWMVQVTTVAERAAEAAGQMRQWLESVTLSA